MTTESQRYNCFIRNERNTIPKHAGPEAKGSNPTTGLTLLCARNPFRGNFNHWQVSRKEAGQVFFKRRTDVKRVSRFKCATWNIRGLGEKEEELDETLNENNIKISVITESKKKLQGTKMTEHYTVIYSGVDRHIRGQSGVMIWIHKSISNKIDNYKFWNNRVIETRLKTQRGHFTILGVYGVTEGRDELTL